MEISFSNIYCRNCNLFSAARHPGIVGNGDKCSNILLIGEAPGVEEDISGVVFVGKSGKLLRKILNDFGINAYITNAVKCRPVGKSNNSRTPTPKEIELCSYFTYKIIDEIKPHVIVLLGSVAMRQLLKISVPVQNIRGRCIYHRVFNCWCVVTYHPAFLVRNLDDKMYIKQFVDDLLFASKLVNEGLPRRVVLRNRSLSDPYDIKEYLDSVLASDVVAIDLETTNIDPFVDKITDISMCVKVGEGVHIKWENIIPFSDKLQKILSSDKIEKVFHNAQFDISFLKMNGFPVSLPIFDTMLAYQNLNSSFENIDHSSMLSLKTLAWLYTTEGGYDRILSQFGGIAGLQKIIHDSSAGFVQLDLFSQVELEDCVDRFCKHQIADLNSLKLKPIEYYSSMDADITLRLYRKFKREIDELFHFPFYEISMKLLLILVDVFIHGVCIDVDYIDKLIEENKNELAKIENLVEKKVKVKLNLNSVEDVRKLIFEYLKVKPNNKFLTEKKQQYAVDIDALKYYAKEKPFLEHLIRYRNITKQNSTFLVGFKEYLNPATNRIHPRYDQLTATFRLACKSPNLQQIPQDNRIRNIIIPANGCKLIVCDLSQIELRVLAMVADDDAMKVAFKSGLDLHSYTACVMFDIEFSKFDKEKDEHKKFRSIAKNINFGMVYQMSPNSLAEMLGISLSKANEFMDRFFNSYPKVKLWIKKIKKFALDHGYVENIYGRRRYLPLVYSSIESVRESALRQAVNTPIQSSASDIFFIGFIRIADWLRENNMKSRIVGTVHDSVLIESPFQEVELVASKTVEFLTTNIPRVTIELEADVSILDRWEK